MQKQEKDCLIKAENFVFHNYSLNFEIGSNEKIGLWARSEHLSSELLLALAGIQASKGLFYQTKKLYDNSLYFLNRLYLDCKLNYFQTLKPALINTNLKNEFNKEINEELLTKLIKDLEIRKECFVYDVVIFNELGNNLINLAVLLASNYHLLVDHPFHALNPLLTKKFINDFKKYPKTIIMTINELPLFSDLVKRILVLGDLNNYVFIEPEKDEIYLHDKINDFFEFKILTNLKNNKEISFNFSKEMKNILAKKKIRYQKVNFYEIEKYLN